jgi:long-subunit acyl-CoA synthetase (AMP-forming)
VHTNASLMAAIAGFVPIVGSFLPSDVYYSYLPLANSLELVCVNSILACGGAVGVYSGHMAYLVSDMEALRPTVISGIPW